jgi:hypothetical protein
VLTDQAAEVKDNLVDVELIVVVHPAQHAWMTRLILVYQALEIFALELADAFKKRHIVLKH